MTIKDRAEAISVIECLYPPDAEYQGTREVSRATLLEALQGFDWRQLPEPLLIQWAERQAAFERAEERRVERKHREGV